MATTPNREPMTDEELVALIEHKASNSLNESSDQLSEIRKRLLEQYNGAPYGDERDGFSKVVDRSCMEAVEWALPAIIKTFMASDRVVEFEPVGADDEDGASQETDVVNYELMRRNDGFLSMYEWIKEALINPVSYAKVWMDIREEVRVEHYEGLSQEGLAMLQQELQDGYEIVESDESTQMVPATPDVMQRLLQEAQQGIMQNPQLMQQIQQQVMAQAQQAQQAGGQPGQQPQPPNPQQMQQAMQQAAMQMAQQQVQQQVQQNQGMVEVPVYSVKVRYVEAVKQLRWECVPGEEVLIDNQLSSLNVDEADFVCHQRERSWTDLVESGHDPDLLATCQTREERDNSEETVRRWRSSEHVDGPDEDDDSMQMYLVRECYIRCDYDGDGVAEHRQVLEIGGVIFENEELNYQPFCALATAGNPHVHEGMSLVEMVADIQRQKTTAQRQWNTNMYRINQPRKYVGENARDESGLTMDALLNGYSEVIPCRDPSQIVPEQIQPLGQVILPYLQDLDRRQMMRSGVSPQMSMDPNVLQQSTAEAYAKAQSKGEQRIELITRFMAETGVKALMLKAHELLRKHQDRPGTAKIRGRWVEYSPTEWRARRQMLVNVGLGFGSDQAKLAKAQMVIQLQGQMAQQGFVTPDNMYNAIEKFCEAADLPNAEQYFTHPAQNQQFMQAQQRPNPQQQLIQAQAMAYQADAQSKQMRAQVEAQSKQAEHQLAMMDRQLKQMELRMREQELMHQMQQAESEARIAEMRGDEERQTAAAERQLKVAQRLKTLQEARALDIENDATEHGVNDLLEQLADESTRHAISGAEG